jgi:2-oxoisovalerate dehydrogenase E1 component
MAAPATRVEIVEQNLDRYLASEVGPALALLSDEVPLAEADARCTARGARELFEDMVLSRALDVAARELKKDNRGFYTIGSSRHEMNVVPGRAAAADRPCFLHYRSGALMMARARTAPGSTPASTRCSPHRLRRGPDQRRPPQGVGEPAAAGCRRRPAPSPRICRRRSGCAFALGRARRIGI